MKTPSDPNGTENHLAAQDNQNPSSSSATLSVTEGEKWEVVNYDEDQIEIMGPKEIHVAFLNNNEQGWKLAREIVAAHNSSLSVTEAHPKEEEGLGEKEALAATTRQGQMALQEFRNELITQAVACTTLLQEALRTKDYSAAHDAELRRQAWLQASDLALERATVPGRLKSDSGSGFSQPPVSSAHPEDKEGERTCPVCDQLTSGTNHKVCPLVEGKKEPPSANTVETQQDLGETGCQP